MLLDPVKLCCGERLSMHKGGIICPDGRVMCACCFDRVSVQSLNVTNDGPEDVCKECAHIERKFMEGRT